MRVVAVAILRGAGNRTEIQAWGEARPDWLRRYLALEHRTASPDTCGTVPATLNNDAFAGGFAHPGSLP